MTDFEKKLKECVIKMHELEEAQLQKKMQNVEPHVFSKEFEEKMQKLIQAQKSESAEEKLRAAIVRVMEQEEKYLEEEMADVEPHVFSEEFERKMAEIMQVKPSKKDKLHTIQFAATMVGVVVAGTVLFASVKGLDASGSSWNIREWTDKFFVVDNEKEVKSYEQISFTEENIGYIPAGFEKMIEDVSYTDAYYKYENNDDYIIVHVALNNPTINWDSENMKQDIKLSNSGIEYHCVYTEENKEYAITWNSVNDMTYSIISTLGEEEILKIMDSISYEGE